MNEMETSSKFMKMIMSRILRQETRLWWVLMPILFAQDTHAQSNETDKSPHKSAFINANGVRLHYLDWGGKGETMLFLHGIGDTAHTFNGFAPRFTNQFRVIGLTRRGHGESEATDSGYDTATRVEDIRQFLDALKISRMVLVAFSASGGEATMFAGKHPDRTMKVIYLDALIDADGQPALYRRAPPELRRPQDMALDSRRRRALELMAATEAHTDYKKIKAPVLAIRVVGFPSNMIEVVNAFPEPRRKVAEEALREVSVVKERETARFRKELPTARLVTLTNANHACFIDREADVLREMRAFLAPTKSPPLQTSLPVPVALEIPLPPTPVKADGKWYLLYELNVTNLGPNNLELVRVEVLRDRGKRPMATYTDEELSRRLKPGGLLTAVAEELRIESSSDGQEPQVISRGNRAVMYMLMTVQREADIPAALHHRLSFKSYSAENSEEVVVVEGARVTVNRKAPLVLSPPLRGEG